MPGARCTALFLLFLGIGCAAALTAHAQDLRGVWQGTLHGAHDQHVVLRIADGMPGQLAAALYRDERGSDLPVETITFDGKTLHLATPPMHLACTASLDRSDTLTGTWTEQTTQPLTLHRTTEAAAWAMDHSPHKAARVQVAPGTSVEVLNWGGAGPPVLLLTGLGNNAHIFDDFAPKLTAHFHVYAMTRRGMGASDWPAPLVANYNATQLGGDVLAVLHALHVERCLLIGHSIAGEELSYVGDHHPEAVRGLVYLDAAYAYAFYDEAHPDFTITLNQLRHRLADLRVSIPPWQLLTTMQQLQTVDLPRFQQLLPEQMKKLPRPANGVAPVPAPPPSAWESVIDGEEQQSAPACPVLAIYAMGDDAARTAVYADAFAKAAPQATVLRLQHASHYVFRTNEADVLGAIQHFADLPNVARTGS